MKFTHLGDFAGEVERDLDRDNDFEGELPGDLLQKSGTHSNTMQIHHAF